MPVATPTYVPKRLAQVMPVVTTDATIYTVPGGALTIVKQIIVANVGTLGALASISFVPNGEAVADGNRLCKDITIDPKRVVIFDLSQVMAMGDSISVQTDVASTLVFTVSGVETTALTFPVDGLEVAQAGVVAGQRLRINFIEGDNIDIIAVDDATNGEVDVIIAVSGNLGHVIKEEGTPLATRAGLNFVGQTVTVTDDAGNDETVVTISGGEADPLIFMGGL